MAAAQAAPLTEFSQICSDSANILESGPADSRVGWEILRDPFRLGRLILQLTVVRQPQSRQNRQIRFANSRGSHAA
jgi:hypothetical protein